MSCALQDPWVMVAEKGNEKSGTALAALVRALHNKQSVALILFLPRVSEKTGGNPTVCSGTPVLVSAHCCRLPGIPPPCVRITIVRLHDYW